MADNSLLNHFLQRLQKDIKRIDTLIQAVYNGEPALVVVCHSGAQELISCRRTIPCRIGTD